MKTGIQKKGIKRRPLRLMEQKSTEPVDMVKYPSHLQSFEVYMYIS